ncbi:MAG TPA: hypothetical protein VK488_15020 [Gaiellaceae bacterium]|nr:hypothetical protein [Gaiellaceae bacterium]
MNAPTGPAHVELSATTDLVAATDKAYASEALQQHLWERRGFLKRLARSDDPG